MKASYEVVTKCFNSSKGMLLEEGVRVILDENDQLVKHCKKIKDIEESVEPEADEELPGVPEMPVKPAKAKKGKAVSDIM